VGSSRTSMGVRPGAWEDVRPGSASDPLLCRDQEVVLGVAPEPPREGHGQLFREPSRPFCAATTIGSFSAPIAGE